jgi:hypothetical protein
MAAKPDARLRLPDGSLVPADCCVHRPTEQYDFNRVADILERENLVGTEICGNSILRSFRAAAVFDRVLAELRKDPLFLVRRGKPIEIPTGVRS